MKFKYFFWGLLAGVIFSVAILIVIDSSPYVVWTTNQDLKFNSGIVIPKGTKLIEVKKKPKGVHTLALYASTWAGYTDDFFEQEVRKGSSLILPYWVGDGFKKSSQEGEGNNNEM